ncbi:MAG: saccharopine dehydrogenase NADP-binding domain-containing protein, partial [Gammaproteobacteria bacterium]|nr:saccharopine dehydrogenase NADP-binding domain-containing protein [Gammaproteobacteria bacterium]
MAKQKYLKFEGRILMVGFGSVAQGLLPLLLRHIDVPANRISIITGDDGGRDEANAFGVQFEVNPLTRDNYRAVLDTRLARGDFLINLSVDVCSAALIEICCERGALYLDTCIEPWPGGHTDPSLSPSQRSNYGQREGALALRARFPKGPTAVLTHGANPGLISQWVKQGLVNLARDILEQTEIPTTQSEWAHLAMGLGIK